MNGKEIKTVPDAKLRLEEVGLFYGANHALRNVNIEIPATSITAIIGPSGCGKSSLLRIFNRTNDLIPGARVEGVVLLDGVSIYGSDMDAVSLRKKVGMVFQKPNPFPMSIYENMIYGPTHHGIKDKRALAGIAEHYLTQVALWEEVKDIMHTSAMDLQPGQQQRLCIARAMAVEPDVILMDESCSALDPESTARIEELMLELANRYTIIIVTHSMEQALRVSDYSAFMMIDEDKIGTVVEFAPTLDMFSNPKDRRTEDYITGRYG